MKTRIVVAVMALLCCLAVSSNLPAQSDDTVQQIKKLQQDAINAQIKNDVAWEQEHLADGFVAGHSWGEWATKAEYIKQLQDTKWKNGKISDVRVATFGPNTAVAHYKFTYDADFNGTHRARSVICSDTWVKESGTWKSASAHCSVAQGK